MNMNDVMNNVMLEWIKEEWSPFLMTHIFLKYKSQRVEGKGKETERKMEMERLGEEIRKLGVF